jgi:aldehyde:ferredoxin oxidoreductase
VEMVNTVTGLGMDKETLAARAAAVSTLVRRFNLREGLSAQDDKLPPKLHRRLSLCVSRIEPKMVAGSEKELTSINDPDNLAIPH